MKSRYFRSLEYVTPVEFRVLMACMTLAIVGCSSELPENERAVFPASGVVTYQGKSIPDATVVLHPVAPPTDDKPFFAPRAVVDKDGTFQFTTYRTGDGAPPGDYRATVSWVGPLDGIDEDDEDRLPERLPRKYTNPRTSGISVTIVAGTNELSEMTLN